MKKSIQWQLVTVIIGSIFVSFFGFLTVMRYFMADDYANFMRTTDLQTTQILSNHVSQSVARPLRREHMLASYGSLMSMSPPAQAELIRKLSFDETSYEAFSLLNAEGVELVRVAGELDSAQIKQRLERVGDWDTVSSVYASPTTGELIFSTAQKIHGSDGKHIGTIVSDVNLRSLQTIIQNFNDQNELSAYLFDQKGIAIAQPSEYGSGIFNYETLKFVRNGKEKEFYAPPGLLRAMHAAQRGERGDIKYYDQYRNEYFCMYRPIALPFADVHWALVLTHSSRTLHYMLDKLFLRSTGIVIVIAFISLWAIAYLSNRITKPLQKIIEMANRIRAGDLSGQLNIKSDNEIGLLADNINYMIQGLRATRKKTKDAETKIKAIAYHDALTGLPNRTHFLIYLRQMIDKSIQSRFYGALLFIDVDKFKQVNDTYGHAVGDGLLIAFAKRIVDIAGRKEVVCRFGGDEFLLFLLGHDETDTRTICQKLVQSMREPFEISGHKFSLSTSVGAALFPKDADNIDDLLERADAALYVSKRSGRDQYNFYVDGMETTPIEDRD